jgi:hypothetical protein
MKIIKKIMKTIFFKKMVCKMTIVFFMVIAVASSVAAATLYLEGDKKLWLGLMVILLILALVQIVQSWIDLDYLNESDKK